LSLYNSFEGIALFNRRNTKIDQITTRTSNYDWIKATDRQIEALVYELYGLTEEEINWTIE